MAEEDAAQLGESLLASESSVDAAGGDTATTSNTNVEGNRDGENDDAVVDSDAPRLLCGMRRPVAYALVGASIALLIAGATLAVVYGRPPDWKLVQSTSSPEIYGGSVAVSGDGSVVGTKLRMTEMPGYDPLTPSLSEVVQLSFAGSGEDIYGGGGQYFRPFPDNQESYPLPSNSEWGDTFEPSYIWTDFALSEDANVFVIMGYAVLYDNWQFEERSYRGLCNGNGMNVTDRYFYLDKECYYQRVATYIRRGDGYWDHEPAGRPIETIVSRMNEEEERGTVVALSADGGTLALGYQGHVDVYDWDDDEESKWKRVGRIVGGVDDDGGIPTLAFGGSVSLNGDGSRVAIGGFGATKVFVYARDGDSSWRELGGEIEGEGPGDFGLTVSLSKAGDRLAVVARDVASATKYDGDVPYEDLDAARVQVFELPVSSSEWRRLGNDITGFNECCSDSGAGSGVTISGDGSTIVVAGGLDNAHVQPHRLSGGRWARMGRPLPVDMSFSAASVTTDGNAVVVAHTESLQFDGSGGASHVQLYSFRRGV